MTNSNVILAHIIIFVIIIAHIYYQEYFDHIDALLWENTELYTRLVEQYGLPVILNPEKGGGAIWNINHQKLTLYDQKYEQEIEPTIHLWTPINLFPTINRNSVRISPDGEQKRIANIINLMPKYMAYDPAKQQILTRFYHLGVAKILTMLAMKITTGELTLKQIQNEKLITSYMKQISVNTSEYDPKASSNIDEYINNYVGCFC